MYDLNEAQEKALLCAYIHSMNQQSLTDETLISALVSFGRSRAEAESDVKTLVQMQLVKVLPFYKNVIYVTDEGLEVAIARIAAKELLI